MSEKQTETSTGGQDMGPFKAGAPFKFTDVQSLQLAIEAYFSARPISDLLAGPDGRKICLARQARRAGNTSRQSRKRIDRYWRDIHCNYPHDEGACNELLNFLRLLPTSCYFDRR
jgi:hypothetical protein